MVLQSLPKWRGTTRACCKMGPPNLYNMAKHNPCLLQMGPPNLYKMVRHTPALPTILRKMVRFLSSQEKGGQNLVWGGGVEHRHFGGIVPYHFVERNHFVGLRVGSLQNGNPQRYWGNWKGDVFV